jgi:hypothetical protein
MNNARKELNERKTRAEIEDNNDEYQIGKVNNETIKIIESTVDKKIGLMIQIKLQIIVLLKKIKVFLGNYLKKNLKVKIQNTT